jgi:hypothetical protein
MLDLPRLLPRSHSPTGGGARGDYPGGTQSPPGQNLIAFAIF